MGPHLTACKEKGKTHNMQDSPRIVGAQLSGNTSETQWFGADLM
jgi:hypothetical protein